MGILQGIGQAIGELLGINPQQEPEDLEDKINNILARERENIIPSRENIDTFSWVTKDNNPIHRLPKRAKILGFEDIPLMGAHIAAYGEQFIERVVEKIRAHCGADLKIIGQDNGFKAPVYPGERILWQIMPEFKRRDGEIQLAITGTVKDKRVIDITSRIGKSYCIMPQIAGPIFSAKYLLDKDHLEEFYNCVGGTNNDQVPNMLPASYVPATLLTLLEQQTQTMEGMNLSMNYEFLREVEPGRLQVDIFPPRKPRAMQRKDEKGNSILDPKTDKPVTDYLYRFRTVVSQDTKPVTYGEILSSTTFEIKF